MADKAEAVATKLKTAFEVLEWKHTQPPACVCHAWLSCRGDTDACLLVSVVECSPDVHFCRVCLQTDTCTVEDLSDGCGAKIDVLIVSDKFDGMGLLDRQRAVHAALEEEMKTIHAITMKCKTAKQWEAMQTK